MRRAGLVAVLATFVIALLPAHGAWATGDPGLEIYPAGDGRVNQYWTANAGFYLHPHSTGVANLTFRIDLHLASRVTVQNIPVGCTWSGSAITCKVKSIGDEQPKALDLMILAKSGAALGAAGYVTGTVVSGVPSGNAYPTSVRYDISVYQPPIANVSAISDGKYHYLHVGDEFNALFTLRNRGPAAARILVAKPDGFSFRRWVNCDRVVEVWCEVQLPSGGSRQVGARFKQTSKTPAEPQYFFSVEDGVADPNQADNIAQYIVCVYESGLCSRDLPGSASNRFSGGSAASHPQSTSSVKASAVPPSAATPTTAAATTSAPANPAATPDALPSIRPGDPASAASGLISRSPLALAVPFAVAVLMIVLGALWWQRRRSAPAQDLSATE